MNNVIANLEGTILTLKIDLKAESKPGKTNGVRIHASNRDFITIAHLQGREIALGSLIITSRPDPKLPRPEIKKAESKPEPKKVSAPAKPEVKTQIPLSSSVQSASLKQVLSAVPNSNPFNL